MKTQLWDTLMEDIYYEKMSPDEKISTIQAIRSIAWYKIKMMIGGVICSYFGHDWVDESYCSPDSGADGGHCERCGWEFYHQMYGGNMIYNGKTGELHKICVSCLLRADPLATDCVECERDLKQEYADYPGDCE